jgi:hypothetical protein
MRVLVVIVLIAICIGGYVAVTRYHADKQGTDGAVHWITGKPTAAQEAQFARENSGEGADGNSEHKLTTPQQDAMAANQNNAAASGEVSATIPATAPYAAPAAQAPVATNTYAGGAGSLPVSDSQSPNALNNLRFGGSGHYEWYRQGNITYRVDPATGASCVAFATLEEWKKQIVYSHGCGRGA